MVFGHDGYLKNVKSIDVFNCMKGFKGRIYYHNCLINSLWNYLLLFIFIFKNFSSKLKTLWTKTFVNKNRFRTPFSLVMRWTLHSDFQLSQMVLFSRKCIADVVFTFSHSSTWKAGVLTLFVAFVDSEDALLRRWMCLSPREKYLFKNRTTEVPPNSYYRSLYPKIIQDIEVSAGRGR